MIGNILNNRGPHFSLLSLFWRIIMGKSKNIPNLAIINEKNCVVLGKNVLFAEYLYKDFTFQKNHSLLHSINISNQLRI